MPIASTTLSMIIATTAPHIVSLSKHISPVTPVTSFDQIVMLVFLMTYIGLMASSVLFIVWLLLVIFGAPNS